jgi:hypothetical protein
VADDPHEPEERRTGGGYHHDLYDEEVVEDARVVRPYALTRGRTRPGGADLPLEALVRSVPGSQDPVGTSERRRILGLADERILSVAELSAHLSLPLGVVRVVVGDLAEEGLVVVHSGSPSTATPATNLKVLESVLNGISSL